MHRFLKYLLPVSIVSLLLMYANFINEPDRTKVEHDHTNGYHEHSHSEKVALPEKLLFPSRDPDRVILNISETAETAVAINWRTDTTISIGVVQWAIATPGPDFISTIKTLPAQREYLRVTSATQPAVSAHYYSADLSNLQPGVKYLYRVGTEGWWSEWHQFQMPKASGKLSFVYFGDAQNDIKSMWSRVIREAYKTLPTVDFMLHAGDLINRSDVDAEWGEWFYAGSFIHSTVPSMMTPGNHEYGRDGLLSPQWRKQFNLPANGPQGLSETCYAVNFSNLKVISLDAEQIDESPLFREQQARWLDSILTKDPRRWTAVTLHYPLFSTSPNRDNAMLINTFKPIFDKHKVDIVLQGHDHAYGRGLVNNALAGNNTRSESGTMYVVSVSGPKMYDITNADWMQRKARNTQLFQVITIENNTLAYQAYTANGELYDRFDLVKSGKKGNKLVNRVPDVPERK